MILVSLDDGSSIVLNKAVMFFGRGHDCDIILSQSRKVSRKHCCVAQINDEYLVRDLGSMNGIRVNEEKAVPELPLKVGDELWIGDVGFQFQPATSNGMAVLPPKEKAPPEAELKEIESSDEVQRQSIKKVDAHLLSMDHPIAIPDEGEDLIIEESIQQKIIEIRDEDILD